MYLRIILHNSFVCFLIKMHKSVEKNLEGLQLDVDCRLDWQLKYFLLQDSALKKKIQKEIQETYSNVLNVGKLNTFLLLLDCCEF